MKTKKFIYYFSAGLTSLGLILLLLAFSQAKFQWMERLGLHIQMSEESIDDSIFSIFIEEEGATKEIKELIANGDFSVGLDGWQHKGHVEVLADANGNFLQLGHENSSNLIQENCVTQQIFLSEDYEFLFISYQPFLREPLLGFNQVAWVLFLDDKVIHVEPSYFSPEDEYEEITQGIFSSDWREKVLKISNDVPGHYNLTLCAGNSGDREPGNWSRFNVITTRVVPLNASQTLTVSGRTSHRVGYSYSQDNQVFESPVQEQFQLIFSQPIDFNELLLTIYQENPQNPEEEIAFEHYSIPVFFSEFSPPKLENFLALNTTLQESSANQYLVVFPDIFFSLSNSLNNILNLNFDIRFSHQPFTPDQWPNLNQAQDQSYNLTASQDLSLLQPICREGYCYLIIETVLATEDLYFAIQTCDITNNCSVISSVIQEQNFNPQLILDLDTHFHPQPSPTPTPTPNHFNIVINEIMFNPLGDDKGDWLEGEWIELYNKGNQEIDLNNWVIIDEAGWEIQIIPQNCDANGIISDDGETTIPAQGYLLAFTRGRAILNNTGDTVYLYNEEGVLIDQIQYPGSSIEDLTYGRVPDGSDNWLRFLPPTPLGQNLAP